MNTRKRRFFRWGLGIALLSCSPILGEETENVPLRDIEVICDWNNPLPESRYRQGVEHHSFLSKSNNVEVGFTIYLPPGYHTGSERYPVQYFLGGSGNDENSQQERWAEHLTPAIEKEVILPMILVWPNPMKNSGYKDSQHMKVESMIIKDLIPHIDATYRTIAGREHRWIGGMSMGGGGCLALAFTYPNLFSSVLAYAPGGVRVQGKLKPDHVATIARENVEKLGQTRVRIVSGEKDRGFEGAKAFHAFLLDLGVSSDFEAIPNIGHDMTGMFKQVGIKGLQFHSNSEGK